MFNHVGLLAGEESGQNPAASITKSASKQTYYIVRFMVDRERVPDAYRAYAYFRWVDDYLDQENISKAEGLTFINHQQMLLDCGYRGVWPDKLSVENRMLANLVQGDSEPNSGLQNYLRNMMAVMAFDAERRGQLVSQQELSEYTHLLASAVTEALHHFIGHNCPAPKNDMRYLAATAAHITHMLRDTIEDAAVGYYNIPREYLDAHQIGPHDVSSKPYRAWVQSRVQLARRYFDIGHSYLAQVQSARCRAAGYLYAARFEAVLAAIERDNFLLRESYPECKTSQAGMKIIWSMLSKTFSGDRQQPVSHPLTVE